MSFIRSNSLRCILPLIGALFVGVPIAAEAGTRHVPADYPTIQAGIDAAVSGDTVLVAPGTYSDFQSRSFGGFGWKSCMFLKAGVAVESEAGPGSTFVNTVVLIGGQGVGVIGWNLSTGPTRVEGFTFLGGGVYGPAVYSINCEDFSVVNCVFDRCYSIGGPGGAMICLGDASVIDCSFYECKSFRAGAIEHLEGRLDLIRCDFERCEGGAVEVAYEEGYVIGANVIDCRFVDNTAGVGAGAFQIGEHGGVTMRGSLFLRNVATGGGSFGGVFVANGPVVIEDCQFLENQTLNGISALWVGSNVSTVVRNCTFNANVRLLPGSYGAIGLASNITFENNIVAGTRGGFAVRVDLLPIKSNCNVFWDNPVGNGIPLSSTDRVADPLFCDPEADDYRLRAGSPCLPEDPLGCGPIGALGQGCGTISVESKSWGAIKGLYR